MFAGGGTRLDIDDFEAAVVHGAEFPHFVDLGVVYDVYLGGLIPRRKLVDGVSEGLDEELSLGSDGINVWP